MSNVILSVYFKSIIFKLCFSGFWREPRLSAVGLLSGNEIITEIACISDFLRQKGQACKSSCPSRLSLYSTVYGLATSKGLAKSIIMKTKHEGIQILSYRRLLFKRHASFWKVVLTSGYSLHCVLPHAEGSWKPHSFHFNVILQLPWAKEYLISYLISPFLNLAQLQS